MTESDASESSTAILIDRIQSGDDAARDQLFRKALPLLRRFARGRLPAWRRDLSETEDLVQVTLIRALNRIEDFDARGRGAFLAYLRTIMMNAVREEIRKHGRKPDTTESVEQVSAAPDSVVAAAIGMDTLDAYEQGLDRLKPAFRDAVILHVEFDMSHAEVAAELGLASADAARMRIKRGLTELASSMP